VTLQEFPLHICRLAEEECAEGLPLAIPMVRSPRPRRRGRLGFIAAAVVTASALTAAPAWAHAELTSIAPDDGAILDAPPRRIELTFSEPLITAAATVVVTDDQDVVVTRDRSRVDGTSVSVPWPPELPPGDYTIAFRVVSGDGHPIKGTSRFTLRPSGPTSPVDASPPAQPEPPIPDAPASGAASSGAATDSQVTETPDDQQSSLPVLRLLAGVIAAIGIGSVVVVRRRRAA